ncbi:hypothetical protein M5689_023488 [Euphorbia peplus]|nr:hypothetical protein M5689_023488 [Euphorbia peplus]
MPYSRMLLFGAVFITVMCAFSLRDYPVDDTDPWEFLDWIDAPSWSNLTGETLSNYTDVYDYWFRKSHALHHSLSRPHHQCGIGTPPTCSLTECPAVSTAGSESSRDVCDPCPASKLPHCT